MGNRKISTIIIRVRVVCGFFDTIAIFWPISRLSTEDLPTLGLSLIHIYDINHETGAKILGDIVISVPKVMEQARTYGHSLEREIGYQSAS